MIARFAAVVAAVLVPCGAHAWDAAGHMLVGQIAWEQTKPEARAKVSELVALLDTQFNNGQPYNFVTAGCWMDDMRSLGKAYAWGRLHYVTIPWTESGKPAPIPPPPNVVSGIEDCMHTLRNAEAPAEDRAKAVGMLIHFVGDIHQPLHTTDRNNDRGGNAYLIAGVPFSDLMEKQGANLHTYWDKSFRFDDVDGKIAELWQVPRGTDRPKAAGEGIVAEQAGKIMAAYPLKKFKEIGRRADATAWAQESHAVGCKSAYPHGEPPDNTEARLLTPEFVKASRPVAERRVALAGYRLARLLNELFAK